MTAYELICGLSEDKLCKLKVDLRSHTLHFGKTLIFAEGEFTNDAALILSEPYTDLISLAEDEQYFTNWSNTLAALYFEYACCVPRRKFKSYNFIPTEVENIDFILAKDTFHQDRIALELYVLFHHAQKDLLWPNRSHFFEKICTNCVIYRDWIT